MQKYKILIILIVVLAIGFSLTQVIAQENQHCVVLASQDANTPSETLGCFSSQQQALSFLSNGQIQLPANASPAAIDTAIKNYNASRQQNNSFREAGLQSQNLVTPQQDPGYSLIGILYYNTNRTGTAVEVVTTNTAGCTTGTGHAVVGFGRAWDNKVKSSHSYLGCTYTQVFDGYSVNFADTNYKCSNCTTFSVLNGYVSTALFTP